MNPTSGQAWSRFGFFVGIVASLAGNIAHTFIDGRPVVGAVMASAFWPGALLISIEVISRVQWPAGIKWWWPRYLGLTSVALIAAVLSYKHMRGLLVSYGEDGLSSTIGPLCTDGLMVVCSVALLAIADNQRGIPNPGLVTIPMEDVYQSSVAETITPAAETILEPEPAITEELRPVETTDPPPLTVAEQARQAYVASTHNGHELSSAELGVMFQRSPRWAREQIKAAKVVQS